MVKQNWSLLYKKHKEESQSWIFLHNNEQFYCNHCVQKNPIRDNKLTKYAGHIQKINWFN